MLALEDGLGECLHLQQSQLVAEIQGCVFQRSWSCCVLRKVGAWQLLWLLGDAVYQRDESSDSLWSQVVVPCLSEPF